MSGARFAPEPGEPTVRRLGWRQLWRLLERCGVVLEAVLYAFGGAFLIAAAAIVLWDAVPLLWQPGSGTARALGVLDRVLLVFVLAEVFHTVRVAVTRHEVEPEPFLVIVIIAGVRRILVVTANPEPVSSQALLLELGLLVLLISASALMVVVLRRSPSNRRLRAHQPSEPRRPESPS